MFLDSLIKRTSNAVLNWEVIRTVGASRTVALASFFPFLGYLILANEQVFEYLELVTDKLNGQQTDYQATFSRLRQIYFALASLSVAVIIFKVSCPSEIKENANSYEFISKELNIVEPRRAIGYINKSKPGKTSWALPKELLDALRDQQEKIDDIYTRINDTKLWSPLEPDHLERQKNWSAWREEHKNTLIQVLGNFYDYQNHKGLIARLAAQTFFTYGFGQLAWPALVTLRALIKSSGTSLS